MDDFVREAFEGDRKTICLRCGEWYYSCCHIGFRSEGPVPLEKVEKLKAAFLLNRTCNPDFDDEEEGHSISQRSVDDDL